ncbi:Lrp/AsnC family transcriptional regulator, partial [Peribacillus simplex]
MEVLERAIASMSEVLELHCLTCEYDYLLKVDNKDWKEI